MSPDGLDALVELRKAVPDAPVTHFVSAAYFTKDKPDPRATASLAEAVHKGDELAVHLHAWRSLARAAKVEPKLHPSFLTGTDKLYEFEDGDIGFDTDPDAYSVSELRALLRTSRGLLEATRLPVSKTFRAAGYLGTPKMLQAVREEGYTVDCSAADYHQLGEKKDAFLSQRIKEVWPNVGALPQPFLADVPGGQLLEIPISAIADYVTVADLIGVFEAAHARLQKDPGHNVFVVLAFAQETAQDVAAHLGEAIQKVRARKELAADLLFTTVEDAATQARGALAPTSGT